MSFNVSYKKQLKRVRDKPKNDGDTEKYGVSSLVDDLVKRYEAEPAAAKAPSNSNNPKRWTKPSMTAPSNASAFPKTPGKRPLTQRGSPDSDEAVGFFDSSDDNRGTLEKNKHATAKDGAGPTQNGDDYKQRVTIENSVPENFMTMWGEKIKAAKPGDPSQLTYRQRMDQADRVKERIERAKAAKREKLQESQQLESEKATHVSEDEDAAALFFGAASIAKASATALPTNKKDEEEDAAALFFSAAGRANSNRSEEKKPAEKTTVISPRTQEKLNLNKGDGHARTSLDDYALPTKSSELSRKKDPSVTSTQPAVESNAKPKFLPTEHPTNKPVVSVEPHDSSILSKTPNEEAVDHENGSDSTSSDSSSSAPPAGTHRRAVTTLQKRISQQSSSPVKKERIRSEAESASSSSSTSSSSSESNRERKIKAQQSHATKPNLLPMNKKTAREKDKSSSSCSSGRRSSSSSNASSSSNQTSGSSSSSGGISQTKSKEAVIQKKPEATVVSNPANDEKSKRQLEPEEKLIALKATGPAKKASAPSSKPEKVDSSSSSSSSSVSNSCRRRSSSLESSTSSASSSASSNSSSYSSDSSTTIDTAKLKATKALSKKVMEVSKQEVSAKVAEASKENNEDAAPLHRQLEMLGISCVIEVENEVEKPISSFSLGNDSYLDDLLNQKQSREQERQEELIHDAAEMYKAAVAEGAPESESMFLRFLQELKKERHEEFREKDRKQDELIEIEQRRRKENSNKEAIGETLSPLQRKQAQCAQEARLSASKEKSDRKKSVLGSLDDILNGNIEVENAVKEPPIAFGGLGEEEIEFETDSEFVTTDEEAEATIPTSPEKKIDDFVDTIRATPSSKNKLKTSSLPQKNSPRSSLHHNDGRSGSNKKFPFSDNIPDMVSVPSFEGDSLFLDLDDEDLSDRSKKRRKMKKQQRKQKMKEAMKRERQKKKEQSRRRRVNLYSDSEESEDSSSNEEYGNTEETLELDLAAVELSRREAALNVQQSKQMRTRLIAASVICFVGFGLLLFFVLDPLGRRDDGNPFGNGGEQRLLRRSSRMKGVFDV